LIFAIGLFLNWSPFVKWSGETLVAKYWTDPGNPESGIRILGVLQRIAMSYLAAAVIVYFFKLRGAFYAAFLLLIAYWLLCMFAGMQGDPYSLQGYFGTAVDKSVLGVAHMYKGEGIPFDPEGLISTITSIVQVLFGYFVGNYIQVKGKNYEMLTNLFVAGCILAFTGLCWDLVFPINKKIWTSSFVLYTSGLATIVLSIFIYLVEFRKFTGGWSRLFDVFGKNPLFIFVLSGFLPRVLALLRWEEGIDPASGKVKYTSSLPWFYEHICKPVSDNLKNGSLLYAITMIVFYWMIVYVMDKKKIYIRV
jgi:predicted acyltransferase